MITNLKEGGRMYLKFAHTTPSGSKDTIKCYFFKHTTTFGVEQQEQFNRI